MIMLYIALIYYKAAKSKIYHLLYPNPSVLLLSHSKFYILVTTPPSHAHSRDYIKRGFHFVEQ